MCKKDLSAGEFELMEVLWEKGEATAREMQHALGANRKLAATTIATMLMRMRKKGCIQAREGPIGRIYHAMVERDQVVQRKVNDLVNRFLGGDIRPLLTYIAEDRGLSAEEFKELEKIVKSRKED
jgi:BlaI family transcriptional regulator, penicillinase repressor